MSSLSQKRCPTCRVNINEEINIYVETVCIICTENTSQVVCFNPCRHANICILCIEKFNKYNIITKQVNNIQQPQEQLFRFKSFYGITKCSFCNRGRRTNTNFCYNHQGKKNKHCYYCSIGTCYYHLPNIKPSCNNCINQICIKHGPWRFLRDDL